MREKLRVIDIVLIVVCIVMMFLSYQNIRKRKQINDVKALPFTNTLVENVQNGTYIGDVQTTFLCIKVEVTVLDQHITDIKVLEKSGSKKYDETELLQKMITENTSFVKDIKGNELNALVYICCVDNALSKGVIQNSQEKTDEA